MNPLTYFNKIRILPILIASALIALATFTPVPARATPSCNVTTVDLLFGANPPQPGFFPDGLLDLMCRDVSGWNLKTKVKGDSDVYVIQNTFTPSAHTGWHTHPGPSLITVIAGAVTVYEASDPTCTPTVYTAGQTFTDIGCGDVHLVRNEGSVNAVVVAVQIVPHGAARRIDVPVAPSNCPLISCP